MQAKQRARVHWAELSSQQRTGILIASAVQIGLMAGALTDLYRRPARDVRGSKGLWAVVSLINFVGPLAYFAFGRKR